MNGEVAEAEALVEAEEVAKAEEEAEAEAEEVAEATSSTCPEVGADAGAGRGRPRGKFLSFFFSRLDVLYTGCPRFLRGNQLPP